ncbi:MAG: tetratricopeptide repeat protein [Bryobacteraceae bacterium]
MLRGLLVWMGLLGMEGAGAEPLAEWQKVAALSERLEQQGKSAAAEQMLKNALAAGASLPSHAQARLFNNLGSVCQDQRRYAEAQRHYQRAVEQWEKSGPAQRMALARTLNNLASLHWEMRRLAEADRVLERSLQLQIEAVGSTHPDAAHLFYNLGAAHLNRNRWNEAEAAFRQFLTIRNPGSHTLRAAVAATNLSLIYGKAGRKAEADSLQSQGRKLWEEARQSSDLTPALLLDLATGFWSRNDRPTAELISGQALSAAESRYGRSHPRTAQAMWLRAAVLRAANRKREAKDLEKRARQIDAGDTQTRQGMETIDVSELNPQATWRPVKSRL